MFVRSFWYGHRHTRWWIIELSVVLLIILGLSATLPPLPAEDPESGDSDLEDSGSVEDQLLDPAEYGCATPTEVNLWVKKKKNSELRLAGALSDQDELHARLDREASCPISLASRERALRGKILSPAF